MSRRAGRWGLSPCWPGPPFLPAPPSAHPPALAASTSQTPLASGPGGRPAPSHRNRKEGLNRAGIERCPKCGESYDRHRSDVACPNCGSELCYACGASVHEEASAEAPGLCHNCHENLNAILAWELVLAERGELDVDVDEPGLSDDDPGPWEWWIEGLLALDRNRVQLHNVERSNPANLRREVPLRRPAHDQGSDPI